LPETVASPPRIRPAAVQESLVASSHVAERGARSCSATTNDPVAARTSLNTARGRRIADLFRSYMAALGNPSDAVTQANVLAATELKVAAEDARKRLLDETGGDANALVRLENLAHRAERKLGLRLQPRDAGPSLHEYLAATSKGDAA
jgi:hypothetical protein